MWFFLACTSSTPTDPPKESKGVLDSLQDSPFEDSPQDSTQDSPFEDSQQDSPQDTAAPPYDGTPCAAFGPPVAMGEVQDEALNELSGIVVSRQNPGILWVLEDSGGEPALYALDTDGLTVATLHFEGATNTDWEDLAVGLCDPLDTEHWCLYVGDIGDLGTNRSEFSVLVAEEPLLDGTPDLTVVPEIYRYSYPDAPEDSEALILSPEGDVLMITKRSDATAGVFRMPALQDGVVLEYLSDIVTGTPDEDLTARATAADLWPDGSHLLLRTYFHIYEITPATDFTALPAPVLVTGAFEFQGESIGYDPLQGGFWQVSEGTHPTLYHIPCASP